MESTYHFPVIGIVRSCFKEKFGIPRQPGLATASKATLEIVAPYNNPDAFQGLELASHIWLQFVFHRNNTEQWRPKVRPPRLGGNKSIGVFATRSPVRPSPIGLSVVKLERLELGPSLVRLHLSGIDLLDGTPVLDIKPYVPYVDALSEATNQFAEQEPALLPVIFSDELKLALEQRSDLLRLIEQVLQQDPRPKYQALDEQRRYGTRLDDVEVRWYYQLIEGELYVRVDTVEPVA
ncbi:tRNA (N6-threonylcarbamoyladenosine(37)-N6)-methyltransferase TrmO [Teredinibacter waterburyi]|uniref:tRNA (N6-threonylcarbamoyladenosine(37)-N6)-methyltransferase TrmO n=1 Tax=Teredinibacter waterburyi TaxID=1500538 RepID=UPI00165FDEDB|nr:tRNA (N6-threonylcarbamoyladenosine(37)-N6)-methyltransferase TrmO [Teredinibacter waterburyi]